jgi:hypothetical protein
MEAKMASIAGVICTKKRDEAAASSLLPASASLLELGLGLLNDDRKPLGVDNGELRENLAVKPDLGFFQSVHEAAVRKTVYAGCCIDSSNPESTEIALLNLAVAEGVIQSTVDRLCGTAKKFAACTSVPFGQLKNLVSSASRFESSFCSWHSAAPSVRKMGGSTASGSEGGDIDPSVHGKKQVLCSLEIGNQARDILVISGMNDGSLAKITFALPRLRGQDMAGKSLPATNLPGAGFAEALGSSAIGLDFGHYPLLLSVKVIKLSMRPAWDRIRIRQPS